MKHGSNIHYSIHMRSEETCRFLFQYFVQRPFLRCKPFFLGNLELDGYCPYHELAFEYNGIQHYSYMKPFHPTFRHFERQIERDLRKQELCKRYGIILCTIPYTFHRRAVYPMAKEVHRQLVTAETQRGDIYMKYRCPHVFRKVTEL